MMKTILLEELGLGKNETKVYLALVDLGFSTTGTIVENSGVPSSKIYTSLNKLMKLGLVSYTLQKRKKLFKATNPENLLGLLNLQKKRLAERENNLSQMIFELKAKQKIRDELNKESPQLQVLEGIQGIKAARELVLEVLSKGDEFVVLGAPQLIRNIRLRGYFNEFHQRSAKKGIKYRALYNPEAREQGVQREKYPLTKVKYLKNKVSSILWIFKDYIVHITLTEQPRIIIIQNRQIAETSLLHFEILWKTAKA